MSQNAAATIKDIKVFKGGGACPQDPTTHRTVVHTYRFIPSYAPDRQVRCRVLTLEATSD